MKKTTNFFTGFFFQFLLSFLYRLIPIGNPLRLPYASPLMAFIMPFGKANAASGFLFGFLNIFAINLFRSYALGLEHFSFGYSALYGFCYGLIGVIAWLVLRNREYKGYWRSLLGYLAVGFIGIIIYDTMTGIVIPCASGTSFVQTTLMQIDWTFKNSLWNLAFVPLAPLVDRWITNNKQLEFNMLMARFKAA